MSTQLPRDLRHTVWFTWLLLAVSLLAAAEGQDADAPSAPSKAAAEFEDVHAVVLPIKTYGYRDLPGDIVALGDGRLLMVYGADNIDFPTGAIVSRQSTDMGRTWGKPSVVVSAPRPKREGENYCCPGLTRLANGDLILNYIYVSQVRPFYNAQTFYRRSVDDGRTWGDQLLMTPAGGSNLGHNDKLVQLTSGRLVFPVEHEEDEAGDDHAGYLSYCFYSDDDGYSWKRSVNVIDMRPVEAQEPHVVELKDGSLLMLLRTYNGVLAQARSTDRGESWSKGELVKSLKISPNSSAINVQRIPGKGDLLLLRTTSGEAGRRTPLVSAISGDDGLTWTHERVIQGDPSDDYGYPSVTFVEGRALVLYHARDGLHVARIGVDWFYGK